MMRKTMAACGLLVGSGVAAGAEGAGPVSPFAGDVGNVVWTVLIFALVVFVLGKYAWGPILGALQKREDFIRASLEQAKRDREQAQATLKEYADKLETARAEATVIVEEGRRDAEVVKRTLEEDARKEATAMTDRAKREIEIATDTAIKELYDVTGRLAVSVASRIIRKELRASEHDRLIAESIEELTRINGKGAG